MFVQKSVIHQSAPTVHHQAPVLWWPRGRPPRSPCREGTAAPAAGAAEAFRPSVPPEMASAAESPCPRSSTSKGTTSSGWGRDIQEGPFDLEGNSDGSCHSQSSLWGHYSPWACLAARILSVSSCFAPPSRRCASWALPRERPHLCATVCFPKTQTAIHITFWNRVKVKLALLNVKWTTFGIHKIQGT